MENVKSFSGRQQDKVQTESKDSDVLARLIHATTVWVQVRAATRRLFVGGQSDAHETVYYHSEYVQRRVFIPTSTITVLVGPSYGGGARCIT